MKNWFNHSATSLSIFLTLSFGSFYFSSCSKEKGSSATYHVFVVAGQSNTHFGEGFNPTIDISDPRIIQLGRNDNNLKLIATDQPLDHTTKDPERIGFDLTFAKQYLTLLSNPKDTVLIIPAGQSATSFRFNNWNKNDPQYNDMIERINFVLSEFPNSHLDGILWHQGESDTGNVDFQINLDQFITDVREEINQPNLPFVLGGMVPFWVNQEEKRMVIDSIIRHTPERIHNIGFADPSFPTEIIKPDNAFDPIHYDASGQRQLGIRYFQAYIKLVWR